MRPQGRNVLKSNDHSSVIPNKIIQANPFSNAEILNSLLKMLSSNILEHVHDPLNEKHAVHYRISKSQYYSDLHGAKRLGENKDAHGAYWFVMEHSIM